MQSNMWDWSDDRVVKIANVWVRPAAVVAVRKSIGGTITIHLAQGHQVNIPATPEFPTVDDVALALWPSG